MLCLWHHMWETTLNHTVKIVHISECHRLIRCSGWISIVRDTYIPDFRNMENRNHMKIFPPPSQFLFWFKPIKQNNSNSKKICLFRRSLNVEKKILRLNLYKSNSNITPEENPTGETSIPFHLKNRQSTLKKQVLKKIQNIKNNPFHSIKELFQYSFIQQYLNSLQL